jgi:hypothetical protein
MKGPRSDLCHWFSRQPSFYPLGSGHLILLSGYKARDTFQHGDSPLKRIGDMLLDDRGGNYRTPAWTTCVEPQGILGGPTITQRPYLDSLSVLWLITWRLQQKRALFVDWCIILDRRISSFDPAASNNHYSRPKAFAHLSPASTNNLPGYSPLPRDNTIDSDTEELAPVVSRHKRCSPSTPWRLKVARER